MGRGARRRARERVAPLRVHLGEDGTGDHLGPLGEGWGLDGPLAELLALYEADTPQALQRTLLIPGRRTDTLCDDAIDAFERVHADDDGGLLESVVLACTHHRWRGVARQLLEALVERGVLDRGHVGQLALAFLHADDVCLTAPGAWLVDFYLQKRHGDLRRLDPAKTYTVHRVISPQLRRWATRETVQGRASIAPVLRRALALESRHAAGVILGLLDAVDRLDEEGAADVVDVALDWPSPSVRLPALQRLAAGGRHGEALRRAEGDRAAHIRRWAAKQRQGMLLTDRDEPVPPADAAVQQQPSPQNPQPSQQSLFA